MLMSYRAYFDNHTGEAVIDQWADKHDERFKPDGKTYFATWEGAYIALIAKMEAFVKRQQERLERLKTEFKDYGKNFRI